MTIIESAIGTILFVLYVAFFGLYAKRILRDMDD